ncbi:MAG: hypothetical protein GXP29_13120, partial [Planctomycetes bacterium]|nr:hypothetical protein [Planctomycetota bacterium]
MTRGTALGLAAVLMCANSGCQDTSPSGDVAASSDTIPFISGETQRVALQSGCAQTVLECSTSRPVVILDVLPTEGQFVTESDSGFVVVGRSEDGSELLRFRGSRSVTGRSGPRLAFSWSSSASDNDPTTYSPGRQFSTRSDATVRLGVGFHYVRLPVRL